MADLTHEVSNEPKAGPVPTPLAKLTLEATTAAAVIVSSKSSARKRVEAVHDLRVALRRLNVVATCFASMMPLSITRKLKRRTKILRRYAGDLRNIDIVSDTLIALKKETSEHDFAISKLLVELDSMQPKLLRKLQLALSRRKYAQLWTWIENVVLPEINKHVFVDSEFTNLARGEIQSRYSDFLLAREDAKDHNVAHLHALRIRAKRLRYTIEIFQSYGVSTAGSEKRHEAEMLQDRLGRLQDLTVVAKTCKAIAAKSRWSKSERLGLLKVADVITEKYYFLLFDSDLKHTKRALTRTAINYML